MINFIDPLDGSQLHEKDGHLKSINGKSFPFIGGIPRFVDNNNYSSSFGTQWNYYKKTQLDSYTGSDISLKRLEFQLGYKVETLKGKNVLEVGCGAGRFTEILVNAGANVHAVDYSSAVEANKQNIGSDHPNYSVCQADVYQLPFPKESFDVVICIGVIQHTQDSFETIKTLYEYVKPGGELVIDHYKFRIIDFMRLFYIYRFVIKSLPQSKQINACKRLTSFFFPIHWAFRKSRLAHIFLSRISAICFYYSQFPQLSKQTLYQWSELDTHDNLTDYYKHLLTKKQLEKMLNKLNTNIIYLINGGTLGNGLVAKCQKPFK